MKPAAAGGCTPEQGERSAGKQRANVSGGGRVHSKLGRLKRRVAKKTKSQKSRKSKKSKKTIHKHASENSTQGGSANETTPVSTKHEKEELQQQQQGEQAEEAKKESAGEPEFRLAYVCNVCEEEITEGEYGSLSTLSLSLVLSCIFSLSCILSLVRTLFLLLSSSRKRSLELSTLLIPCALFFAFISRCNMHTHTHTHTHPHPHIHTRNALLKGVHSPILSRCAVVHITWIPPIIRPPPLLFFALICHP
jgi:hypothetical protein